MLSEMCEFNQIVWNKNWATATSKMNEASNAIVFRLILYRLCRMLFPFMHKILYSDYYIFRSL
jgi:hypothetical protein